jgi:ABC-type branched-subunit amino acid transport system substrate-binding protein
LRREALVALLAVTATACAGGVGHRRDAAAGSNATAPNPALPSAQRLPALAPSLAGAAGGAEASGTTRPAGAATGMPDGASVSGPAALATRPGAATRGSPTAGSGQAAVPARAAAGSNGSPGAGSPSPPPATGAGEASAPSAPAPAPLPAGGTTVGVTKDTVTIGLFYPKTGPYAGITRNAPAIVQAAFDEAGPINGRRLVLKTYDDGTANAATIQVEEKRAKDESFALMSGVGETNVVLAPLADRHHVPAVIVNIDEQVALPLTYVFAITAYWRRQAMILPEFIKHVLGAGDRRIGIVYEGTSTAKNGKEGFKARAAELGLKVVYEQPIAQAQSACANEVANLQAHNVEVVFMMNGPLGAICMLRDARALSYHPVWTGVGASWNLNLVATASGGAADGIRTLSTSTTLETPAGRHYAAFVHRYLPNSGLEDDDLMLLAYGFTQTLLEGLRRTGPNLTREAFVQTFETKINGFDSGYLPPPTFGPGNRSGPLAVGVTACCSAGKWTTPQVGWRADF